MRLEITVEELRELCSGSVCLSCASRREIVAEPPKEDCQQERQNEPQYEPLPTDIASVVVGNPTDFFSVGTLPHAQIFMRDGTVISTYGEIREDSIYLSSQSRIRGRILFNPIRYEDELRNVTYPIEVRMGGFSRITAVYFLIEDSHFSAGARGKANLIMGRNVFYGVPFVCDELGNIQFESKNPFTSFAGVLGRVRCTAHYWNFSDFAATFSHTLGLCAPYNISVLFVKELDVPVASTPPVASFEEVPEYLANPSKQPPAPVFVSDPPVVIDVVSFDENGMKCKVGRDMDFFPAKQEQHDGITEKAFVGQRYAISVTDAGLVLRPLSEACTERYGRAVSSHWAFKKIVKAVIDGRNESCVLTNSDGTQFYNLNPKFKPAMRGTRNAVYFSNYLNNGALEFSIDSEGCWPYNGTIVATPDSDFAYFNSPYLNDYGKIEVEFTSLPASEENRLRVVRVTGGQDAQIQFGIGPNEKGCFTAELSAEGTLRGDGWELVWEWAAGPGCGRWVLKGEGKEYRVVHCDHWALSKIKRINIWKDRKRCTVFDSDDASFMLQIESLGHDALFCVGNREEKDGRWPLNGILRQDAAFGHWYFRSDYRNCNERGGGEYPVRVTFE